MTEPSETKPSLSDQIDFSTILNGAKNYTDIQVAVQKAIDEKKQKGIDRIGFVSGGIRSGAEGNIDREKMRMTVGALQMQIGTPVFASTNIFDNVWKDLQETQLTPEQRKPLMLGLFRDILRSGVTDIFMIKGWNDDLPDGSKKAPGAVDEHTTAQNLGITVHDIGSQ